MARPRAPSASAVLQSWQNPARSKAPARPGKQVAKTEKTESVPQGRAGLPRSRQGKKAPTGYFDPEVLKQLKVMAAADETTIRAPMSEAPNDLFKK